VEFVCALLFVLALLAAAVVGIGTIFSWLARSGPPPRLVRYDSCPACDEGLRSDDRRCPACDLDLGGRLAERLEAVRVARREVWQLRDAGDLDAETADRVADHFNRRRESLLRPPPRPAPAAPPPAEPVVARVVTPPAERPPPVPPPAAGPDPPRRPPAVVLAEFLHERNILWGELAGGLLIVGCSIALVVSLWRTLEALPYFPFLLLAGVTAATFGAGQYTLHHWKLTATSRGLLAIALLLAPLNLLLLADPGPRGSADWVDAAVKLVGVLAGVALVRTAGRDLIALDELPGRPGWLLAVAVVGPPASQIVPAVAGWPPVWLPLLCAAAACGAVAYRLDRGGNAPLGERPAGASLAFVGLGMFALFAAWGFLLTRSADLAAALRDLAGPLAVAGVPVLAAGLVVQRRVAEPVGLRAAGTAVALAGVVVMLASLVLAWPDPGALTAVAGGVAGVLTAAALRDRLPWLHIGGVPCAALAAVLTAHGLAGRWEPPAGADPGWWLAGLLGAAESGAVLAGFALALTGAAEGLARRGRPADARGYAAGGAAAAAVGLLLVTGRGAEQPAVAAGAHAACAAGFVAANFRWRSRTIAQVGVWLVLVASLWGLRAAWPGDYPRWAPAVAVEGLALAAAAVGLSRSRREPADARGQ
jgi:hypothetical protein